MIIQLPENGQIDSNVLAQIGNIIENLKSGTTSSTTQQTHKITIPGSSTSSHKKTRTLPGTRSSSSKSRTTRSHQTSDSNINDDATVPNNGHVHLNTNKRTTTATLSSTSPNNRPNQPSSLIDTETNTNTNDDDNYNDDLVAEDDTTSSTINNDRVPLQVHIQIDSSFPTTADPSSSSVSSSTTEPTTTMFEFDLGEDTLIQIFFHSVINIELIERHLLSDILNQALTDAITTKVPDHIRFRFLNRPDFTEFIKNLVNNMVDNIQPYHNHHPN